MTSAPFDWVRHPPQQRSISPLRMVGTVLRTVFIVALLLVTIRVSLPQNETIWTAYETPGDLVRIMLGLLVCGWVGFQLFAVPKDNDAHRTWIYLGLAAVPFAAFCALAVW